MNDHISELRSLEMGYQPSDEVARLIGDKTLLSFVGAFAVGKTTLMRRITAADSRFSEVVSFTTRPSRGPDDNYRFIEPSDENLRDIAGRARQKSLVNLTVHPSTGFVYGTEPNDYKSEFCILTTTASSFDASTGQLPFRVVRPVVVVAEPDVWSQRIIQRTLDEAEYQARLVEARQSLKWSLSQQAAYFLDNTSEDIDATAKKFIDELDSGLAQSNQHRAVASRMLHFVEQLL